MGCARRTAILAGLMLAVLGSARPAQARERLIRTIDLGLAAPNVWSLGQDARGFLWIGSGSGLSRWDGQELQRIAPDVLVKTVIAIRPAGDELYVVDRGGRAYRVDGDIAERIVGPDGRPLAAVRDVLVAGDRELWIVDGARVLRRQSDGTWRGLDGVVAPRLLRAGPGGVIYVASSAAVWRIDAGRAVQVADGDGIVDVLATDDGRVHVAEFAGRVRAFRAGVGVYEVSVDSRAISMTARGTTVWVSYAGYLVALPSGGPAEILDRHLGIDSGGPLLVDAEGSLWVGSFDGLLQLPEPDTVTWTVEDGVPEAPRFLARSDEGIWVSSWDGLGWIRPDARRAEDIAVVARDGACIDGQGRMWTVTGDAFVVRTGGAFITFPLPAGSWPHGLCDTAPDGRVWLPLADGLFRTDAMGGPPAPIAPPPGPDPIASVLEDRRGRLWVSRGEQVCRANLGAPVTAASWRCAALADAGRIDDLEETAAGSIWAGTEQAGVMRWDEDLAGWTSIAGSLALPSRVVLGLATSPRGGMWIAGTGILVRVRERGDLAEGWEIVESLTAWNGLPPTDYGDVLEDPDGTLWIAGRGVYQVPVAVRDAPRPPPRVELTALVVDGQRHDPTAAVDVTDGRNRIELSFAALSYRDRTLLRYKVRLRGDDWSEITRVPSFRFADLPDGDYQAEVTASLDGVTWSAATASPLFRVRAPWWRRGWVRALFAVAVVAAFILAYRVRLAMKLRLARQRTQIALDLHDEIGSGLGSIGVLAALAADDTVPADQRRAATGEIATAAGDLGGALGDIVWSLRPGSGTLDALVAHLTERGARLFVDERTQFSTELAPIPEVALALPVSRNLQLICFEALHNAARHAGARTVVLGLTAAGRGRWRLWIEDDGVGLPPVVRDGALGLMSMRRRAAAIGAELYITGETGVRVEVTFALGARASHGHARGDRG